MKSLTQVLSFIQGALMVGTGVAQGAKAIADYNYAMDQAELTELKAILERLLAILKANQAVDQQMLEAIFGAIRKNLDRYPERISGHFAEVVQYRHGLMNRRRMERICL